MENLTNKLQALEVRQKEILDNLKGSFNDKRESKNWREYQENKPKITKLKMEISNQKQANHINSVNEFHNIINSLIPSLQSYKDSFLNKDGSTPKKFKTFLSTLDLQGIHVYCTQRYSFSSVEIVFSGNHSLKHTIDVDRLEKFEPLKNYNIDEIIEAQQEHNKLLQELTALEGKISLNYLIATAEHNIGHSGNRYNFTY